MDDRSDTDPIAETYDELQAIHLIEQACEQLHGLSRASELYNVRAALQAHELCIGVLQRLTERADNTRLPRLLRWLRVFASIGGHLANVAVWCSRSVPQSTTAIQFDLLATQSEAALRNADHHLQTLIVAIPMAERRPEFARLAVDYVNARRSLIGAKWVTWDSSLGNNYEEVVRSTLLAAALDNLELSSPTVFLQFRALHQIPEVLVRRTNDCLDEATRLLVDDPIASLHNIVVSRLLMTVVVECAQVLADELSLLEYHSIRRNLGVTSGSHSQEIHERLFNHSYPALARALSTIVDSTKTGMKHEQLLAATEVGLLLERWRLEHLRLPRNNLGRGSVRSLIGATEAVDSAQRMGNIARAHDILWARDTLSLHDPLDDEEPLKQVDETCLQWIAEVTRASFPDVQDRTGIFGKQRL